MIRVRNLRKAYGTRLAVDGIAFDIGQGETFGLLGPNGAGKTTTMHMLVGALRSDGGEIAINGICDPARPEVRGQVGLAPQALALYEELTAEENLRFFGKLYGLAGARLKERVAWALELSGLTERRADRVNTYSGGMKRRLNLVGALLHDPPVLLLDEPTAGVDPQSRNHLFENIEALAAQGRTILYTTLYMEEAQRLCDRIAIMDQGKILALDTLPGLLAQYGGPSVIVAELESPPPAALSWPGRVEGNTLRMETDRPLEVVACLTATGVPLVELRIERPDLEQVFLNLTGRRLRDSCTPS